jgi:tol-pal system protein YbgF
LTRTAFGRALAGLACVALCGCVTVPEFQILRKRVTALEQGGAPQRAAEGWDTKGAPSGNRLADLDAEVQGLRDDVARLRGEVDELRKQVERGRGGAQSGSPSGAAAATGGAAIAGGQSGVGAPNPSTAPPATSPPQPTGQLPGSTEDERDYNTAYSLFSAQKYADAIDRFQAFLQTHPSSEYADNALFWMGESYVRLNDFEQAAVTFHKVVQRFPNGNKVPDALLQEGVALIEIGNRSGQQATHTPAACKLFKRIVDEYPNSNPVPQARRQLEKCPS